MTDDAPVTRSRCRPDRTTVSIKHDLCQSLERVLVLRYAAGQTYLSRANLIEEAWNVFVQQNYPHAGYAVAPAEGGMTSGAGVSQSER